MKKILVIALGLGFALGTVSFAQSTDAGTDKKMTGKRKRPRRRAPTPKRLNSLPGGCGPSGSAAAPKYTLLSSNLSPAFPLPDAALLTQPWETFNL